MALDLLIIGIMAVAIIRGKVKGFMETVVRFIALIGALFLGVMGTESVANILYATPIDENMIERLNAMAQDGVLDLSYFIPEVLSESFGALEDLSIRVTVLHFTNVAISIFAFMIIVISVWIVATYIIHKLRKSKREKGVIGSVDSSVGLLLGALKGAILVCLLLAFMFPVTGIFMPDKIEALNNTLSNSFIAGRLYDINPLLVFMKKLVL